MSILSSMRGYTQRAVSLPLSSDLYRTRLTLLDGRELDLRSRRGLPTLVVNTASKCGHADQFHGLQAIYDDYRDRGLLVVGCPSSDFGGMEFEEPEQISLFCHGLFEVDFPLTQPMAVRFAPDRFWRELAEQPGSGPPVWSFNKYLIGGNGRVCGWWSTNVRPHSVRIRDAIEAALPAPSRFQVSRGPRERARPRAQGC
jgi:glutathione peroxidase